MRNKQVRTYTLPGSNRCSNFEHFYMPPLPKTPVDDIKPWYTRQRIGVNTIKQFLSKICSSTGNDTKYTNHSLRATAITRMFNGSIPEKVIAEKSGHKSIKALRCYEKHHSNKNKWQDN